MESAIEENNPLNELDDSKEAFLRQMSTNDDPEEDIYTATDSPQVCNSFDEIITIDNGKSRPVKVDESSRDAIAESKTLLESCFSDANGSNEKESIIIGQSKDKRNNNESNSSQKNDSLVTTVQNPQTCVDHTLNIKICAYSDSLGNGSKINVSKYSTKTKDILQVDDHLHERTNNAASAEASKENDKTVTNTSHGNQDFEGPDDANDELISLSGKLDILEYSKSEWKGGTYKAECMREGYQKIVCSTGCTFMRQIRGDNYCALRASAFQILSQNINILSSHHSHWQQHIRSLPERLLKDHECEWLNQWTFADRLPSSTETRLSIMHECLYFLIEQKKISEAMENISERQNYFLSLFNKDLHAEIKIFEAIKLLMLETAVSLNAAHLNGEDVPVFAWLLFARDTCANPKDLMLNHLNPAGKAGGLEQVEMCLLGQALEVTVRVFRPSNVNEEDFITHYPDHKLLDWEKIDLIAEDDRHYNIVIAT